MNPIDGVHEFSAYSGDEDFHCDQCDCAKEIGEDERGFQFLYCKKWSNDRRYSKTIYIYGKIFE